MCILTCYWFSCDLIPAYWCIINSLVTLFQQLKYCWFSWCYLIPPYWCIIDSHVPLPHSHVTSYWGMLLILMWPHSSILRYCWFSWWPHSSILMCYWFSCDLIPAYWGIANSQVTILRWPHSSILMCIVDSFIQHTDVLLILMWPHSSILICIIDSHVTSF